MTCHLIIMRHALSAHPAEFERDHDRALTDRGRMQVMSIASQIQKIGIIPALILHSDARRTTETAKILAPELSPEPNLVPFGALYQANAEDILNVCISTCSDEDRVPLMVVAHNPTMESLLELLSSEFRNFSPADAALLKHSGGSMIEALKDTGKWQLTHFISAI